MTEVEWGTLKAGDRISGHGEDFEVIDPGTTLKCAYIKVAETDERTWEIVDNCSYYSFTQGGKPPTRIPGSDHYSGSDHYKQTKFQPLEVILEWQDTWPVNVRFHLGCILKYLGRLGRKDEALMELKKIKHYAEEAIRVLETQVSK